MHTISILKKGRDNKYVIVDWKTGKEEEIIVVKMTKKMIIMKIYFIDMTNNYA